MYKIIRFYLNPKIPKRTILTGLTFKQALTHCSDPESSSTTCTNKTGKARTRKLGQWFDGFTDET